MAWKNWKNISKESFRLQADFQRLLGHQGYHNCSAYSIIIFELMDFNYQRKHTQQFYYTYCPCDILNCLLFKIIRSVCHSTNGVEPFLCVQDNEKH